MSRLFRACSDPTRVRILHLLFGGESCVCDIMEVLMIPQAKTSRHLGYLRRAGLVEVREEGHWSFYSLAPAKDPFHAKLFECLSACFKDLPELPADARRAERLRGPRRCCPG